MANKQVGKGKMTKQNQLAAQLRQAPWAPSYSLLHGEQITCPKHPEAGVVRMPNDIVRCAIFQCTTKIAILAGRRLWPIGERACCFPWGHPYLVGFRVPQTVLDLEEQLHTPYESPFISKPLIFGESPESLESLKNNLHPGRERLVEMLRFNKCELLAKGLLPPYICTDCISKIEWESRLADELVTYESLDTPTCVRCGRRRPPFEAGKNYPWAWQFTPASEDFGKDAKPVTCLMHPKVGVELVGTIIRCFYCHISLRGLSAGALPWPDYETGLVIYPEDYNDKKED